MFCKIISCFSNEGERKSVLQRCSASAVVQYKKLCWIRLCATKQLFMWNVSAGTGTWKCWRKVSVTFGPVHICINTWVKLRFGYTKVFPCHRIQVCEIIFGCINCSHAPAHAPHSHKRDISHIEFSIQTFFWEKSSDRWNLISRHLQFEHSAFPLSTNQIWDKTAHLIIGKHIISVY